MIRTFIKNSSILTTYTMVAIPLGYVIRLQYANNLSITEFGLFYALLNFFGFISVFNDFGFSETQRYFLPRYLAKKEYDKVKSAIIASFLTKGIYSVVLSFILYFSAHFLSVRFFRITEATIAFQCMILYWFLSGMLTNICDIFFAYKDAVIYGSTEVVRMTLTFVSVVLFFHFLPQSKFFGVIWGWIAVYFVMVFCYLLLFIIRHGSVFQAGKYPLKKIYMEFIPFLIPTAIQSGILTLLNNSTVMILTFIKGVDAVALYNIAQPIANILLLFVTPLASLLLPVTIEFDVKKQHHKIRQIILIILNLGVFVLLPFVLLLSIYSYEVIALLFKSVYTQASVLLKLASFQIFFVIMNYFVSTIVSGFGMPKQRAKVYAIAAVINICFSFFLITIFGTNGAIFAGMLTYIFMLMSWIRLIRSKMSLVLPWKNYVYIGVLTIMLIAMQMLLSAFIPTVNTYIKMSLISSISLLLYFSMGIFVFRIIDIRFLKKLLTKVHASRK